MYGDRTEEAWALLSLSSSKCPARNGGVETATKGAISDTNIIKSLESKLAVFLPKDSGMGERSVIDPAANAVTQRYNSIISASSMTASKSPCGGESHSSWVDRKSKVGRRYKYSQLDWYRIKGACNRKRDSANGRYSCTSPERTPQGRGLKQHVQTDSGYVSRDACPYYACDEARSSATVTATTANGYCTPVSQVTTMPFIPMGTSTFGEMARPFTSSSLPMPTSRVHSCSVCAEEFSSYDLLSSHISTHVQAASQPVVRCPFCGDGFKDPIAFFDHTANHVDHNPFQTEFGTDKQEIIRKQSTESVRMSEERDPISIARWGDGLPTSGRSPFKYDTEIQSERTELQEQEMTERRHTLTRNETHYHYDGNTAVSDASADSGVSSPVAPTVTQSVVSPPVSFSVAPLTPSHSVTKTHFCFTGSAAGAMSSVEPSYGYPFASSTATTPVESIGTGNATPSTSSSVEFPTPSHDAEAIEESSPSFQAEDSPATEGCMNGTAVDGNPQHAVTPESDTQEAQQSLGIQTPYACDILSVSEEASSPQESHPGRRRKRLCSTLSDTAVSDVQSDDLDICQIKYVPSRRRRASTHSGCLQLPRPQAAPPITTTTSNVCSICGKSFRLRAYLRIHQRLHTGELPYPCHVCGKRFNQSWNRNVHMRVHSGIHPHRCKMCCKNFRSAVRLREHLSVIHALPEIEIAEKMRISAIEDMANEMHGRQ